MKVPRGAREAALAVVAALAVLGSLELPVGQFAWRRVETASLDLRFQMRGPLPIRNDIALVMVDDASLVRIGRWPFSRHIMASAVDRLAADQAKLIVFDQLFFEPEQPKPANLRDIAAKAAAALPASDTDLRNQLQALATDDPDGDFAAAISRAGNVLLPFAFTFGATPRAGAAADPDLSDAAYQQFDRSAVEPESVLDPNAVQVPIPALMQASAGLGHVDIFYDLDSAPRYEYLAIRYQGDYLPTLSVRAASAAMGVPWEKVAVALGDSVRIGSTIIPTDRAGRMVVNYHGRMGTFPTYSLTGLLDGSLPQATVKDRIVILGASFVGNEDANAGPFDSTKITGSERMANVIESILDAQFIREVPISRPIEAAVLLLAALTGLVAARLPTRNAALAALVPAVLWFTGAQIAFGRGWWAPVAVPVASLMLAASSAILYRYWVTDRERRQIKSTFSRYMPPKLVEFLAAHPDRVKLGGETRRVTVMFCDVRDFTTISEGFAGDPQGLIRLINRFLTAMANIIHDHDGTIDKYIGDCIMAYWNAPLDDIRHADLACSAALAMRAALVGLNAELEAEAMAEARAFHPLRVGIGLNTGDCVLGNMGSAQTVQSFSALGDPVNLASRLEGQCKTYGVEIVLGETTKQEAQGWALLELDLIAVKGKRQSVRIHGLIGDRVHAETSEFQYLEQRHAAMLDAYRRQHWPTALAILEDCATAAPALAALYDLFRQRIQRYAVDPPGPEWDGVYVALSK